MPRVCRLCLVKLYRGSICFKMCYPRAMGFIPYYRDRLTTCIPEMELDLIPNPVICNNCCIALESLYTFKSRCLMVEKKIRNYVASRPSDTTIYNLSEINTLNLPKPPRFESRKDHRKLEPPKLQPPNIVPPKLVPPKLVPPKPVPPKRIPPKRIPPKLVPPKLVSPKLVPPKVPSKLVPILPKVMEVQNVPPSQPPSILSNLFTVILPYSSEFEVTNIGFTPTPTITNSITYTPFEKDMHGLFTCNHRDQEFPNVPSLHTHQTRLHEEDYLCNFCNIAFKTLQNLRNHQCQNDESSDEDTEDFDEMSESARRDFLEKDTDPVAEEAEMDDDGEAKTSIEMPEEFLEERRYEDLHREEDIKDDQINPLKNEMENSMDNHSNESGPENAKEDPFAMEDSLREAAQSSVASSHVKMELKIEEL